MGGTREGRVRGRDRDSPERRQKMIVGLNTEPE